MDGMGKIRNCIDHTGIKAKVYRVREVLFPRTLQFP